MVDSQNIEEAVEWLKRYPSGIEWRMSKVDLARFNSQVDYAIVGHFRIEDPQVRMIFKLTFGGV